MRAKIGIVCVTLALLQFGLWPGLATAGPSVSGHGKVAIDGPPYSPSQISIDAWLDDDGVAYGRMVWNGDNLNVPHTPGGPTDPWFLDVEDLFFIGNTVYVTAVVTHSLFPADIGQVRFLIFTDNSDIGEPDEINGIPITAGNITVED
jgi:hypothetical protein